MATDKYQGFETMQFIGIFLCDGEGGPIVLGLDASAATDALIRRIASDEEAKREAIMASAKRFEQEAGLPLFYGSPEAPSA